MATGFAGGASIALLIRQSVDSRRGGAILRYVCVHNRNRDNYEVALALEEAGLLELLVTDFYTPRWWPQWLRKRFARRQRQGLTSQRTRSSLSAFIVQYGSIALGFPQESVFARTDRMLARTAASEAEQRGCGLFAYSSYLEGAAQLPAGRTIDFEYHPHPDLGLEILAEDYLRFPAVSWSFEREQLAVAAGTEQSAWQAAGAVVCASDMTRRSLEHAGCPPERITVIPYGLEPSRRELRERPSGPCRFLFVGQGIQRKGLHHVALAWAAAAARADAELTVVSYTIDPAIETMLDQPGVILLGRQSPAALADLFARADVFIMPSLVEGFGLVYLEALQAGCHVVGTANTGLPDLGLSAQAVTLVLPGEIAALSAVIGQLANRKAHLGFDPVAIRTEAELRNWADFRREIAEHAASFAASGPA